MKKSVIVCLGLMSLLMGCSSYSKYAWQNSSDKGTAQKRFPAGSGYCFQNENGAIVSGGKFGGSMSHQDVEYEEYYENSGIYYKNPQDTCHVKAEFNYDVEPRQVRVLVKDPNNHNQCPAEILGIYRDCHADTASPQEEQ